MASQNPNIENLTTDACPSPPREQNDTNNSSTGYNEEKVTEEPTSYTSYKKKKPKVRKPPTQVANVININKANGIHIGSNLTFNIGKSYAAENTEKEEIAKTEAISKLLERTDNVTTEIISFVAEHIGKNWKVVGRVLGYSDGQLYQFNENNHLKGIREVVYQMLLDWIQNKAEKAKVGVLFTTLWDSSERDVVRRMAHPS